MTPSTTVDPQREIMALASQEPAPSSRRVEVTPPARRTPPVASDAPQEATGDGATRTAPKPAKPKRLGATTANSADEDDPYSAQLRLRASKPTGRRRTAAPFAPGAPAPVADQARTTSTTLPLPLLDQLHRARLADEMAGRRFKIQQRLNDAILALPTDPREVLAALQHHRHRLNFGVGTDEARFIEEGRFTFRVTNASERHIAAIISGLYDHLGRRVHRQDLFGLAMIQCVAG